MSTPQTVVKICSGVRLNNRYEHTIYFANATAQRNYFSGKVVKSFTAYSFIRRSWKLRVESTLEDAVSWSYLYFQNVANGKTYYYFINGVEYVNDATVELSLELDVLQTYLFDIELLPCFVERQHTVTDVLGENTVDEGLEVGELESTLAVDVSDLKELAVVMLSSFNPLLTTESSTATVTGAWVNKTFSGLGLFATEKADWLGLGTKLQQLSEWGKIDGIVAMWMYPKALIPLTSGSSWGDGTVGKSVASNSDKTLYYSVATRNHINGYTPRNNKVLCYPYNFLYLSNNSGGASVYRFERFSSDACRFKITGALSAEASIKMTPENYNGVASNYEEGLTFSGLPSCAWNADVYKLWLAQNQNQHNLAYASGGLKIVAGTAVGIASAMTGNMVGAVGGIGTAFSGGMNVESQLAQRADKEIQPPQARGSFSASINAVNEKTFTFYYKSITRERARIIDDYFTMYGYRIQRVQKPNINARPAFTYVKTIGCHIESELNNDDAVAIEKIFDHGVTFWKVGDRICDYTQSNDAGTPGVEV